MTNHEVHHRLAGAPPLYSGVAALPSLIAAAATLLGSDALATSIPACERKFAPICPRASCRMAEQPLPSGLAAASVRGYGFCRIATAEKDGIAPSVSVTYIT